MVTRFGLGEFDDVNPSIDHGTQRVFFGRCTLLKMTFGTCLCCTTTGNHGLRFQMEHTFGKIKEILFFGQIERFTIHFVKFGHDGKQTYCTYSWISVLIFLCSSLRYRFSNHDRAMNRGGVDAHAQS